MRPFLFQKKFLLLAAVVVLAVLPLLLVTGLQLATMALHQTREQRLDVARVQTIVLDEASIVWEETNQELKIGDRYFDVTGIRKVGRKLELQGHFDDAETKIWNLLKQAVKAGQASGYQWVLLFQCLLPLVSIRYLFNCAPIFPRWTYLRIGVLPTPSVCPLLVPPRCGTGR